VRVSECLPGGWTAHVRNGSALAVRHRRAFVP
jgi:hypothetical protein